MAYRTLLLVPALALLSLACDERQMSLEGGEETRAEPTGQACDAEGEVAMCSDGSSAFCGWIEGEVEGEGAVEYGPCLADEEIECEPGMVEPSYVDELCGQMYKRCEIIGGLPTWQNDTCDTPLVLRFDETPIEMIPAEATPMATFDISMRGDSCITTDWPSAATPWLALDVDHSGTIDGGHELFGSGSRMRDGSFAHHGFMALAQLDADASGSLDAGDPAFAELLLWRDHDGDRRSLPSELEPLAGAGITSLPLRWTSAIECDERGNCANQRAGFSHAGGAGEIVDVYLSCH